MGRGPIKETEKVGGKLRECDDMRLRDMDIKKFIYNILNMLLVVYRKGYISINMSSVNPVVHLSFIYARNIL